MSLVAFDFRDARVLGLKWPGFTDFPETNLRFYVRVGERRGVCFLREYVPSRSVAWVARVLYNEPYRAVPYRKVGACHEIEVAARVHRIGWECGGAPYVPCEDSLAHFVKEHDLGVGRRRSGIPLGYRVVHPVWRVWPHVQANLDVDFGALFGPQWKHLAELTPLSVVLAEGSAVRVFGAMPLNAPTSAGG